MKTFKRECDTFFSVQMFVDRCSLSSKSQSLFLLPGGQTWHNIPVPESRSRIAGKKGIYVKVLLFCGAGILMGLGLWVLYRGRLYLGVLIGPRRSRRTELMAGALLATLGTLLLVAGCQLVLVVWEVK